MFPSAKLAKILARVPILGYFRKKKFHGDHLGICRK